ncbi:MAG: hypothetical protein KDK70_11305 [Myxococcales bacterium]|nr:hypothetical protein [Myxococcales bacterium]
MRSPWLVVMVVAGLSVVVYAFTVVVGSDDRPSPSRTHERAADDDAPRARRTPRRVPPRARPRADGPGQPTPEAGAAPGVAPGAAAPTDGPSPGPAPRPKPEISLEDARKGFADYMAELERLEADGTPLTSPQWVEFYKRGHDALLPLQQHLSWQVASEADELRRANEDMRAKLQALQPAAAESPSPPPSPP